VLASSAGDTTPASGTSAAPRPGRAVGYGTASGASFGLFFLLIRNAGQSGKLWPVAAGRIGELAVVLIAAAVLRRHRHQGTGHRSWAGPGHLRRAGRRAGLAHVPMPGETSLTGAGRTAFPEPLE